MSFSAARSLFGVRAGLGASALVLASLLMGCAAEAEDAPGAQFPQGPAPGTSFAPVADSTGVLYGQPDPGAQAGVGDTTIGAPDPAGPASDEYADTDPSALTDFHTALDPYGQWVEDPNYGTIWQPSTSAVGTDFAPYETNGYWSYGDSYVWVSGYPWGWAPFHYGRWVYASNGWGWIPGRQYAGAWTTWRTGYGPYGGYVGWAPLPPTWYWRGGMAVGIGVVPYASYGFCSTGNLFASSLGGRMVAGPQVAAMGQYSQPVLHGGSGVGGGGGWGGSGRGSGRTLANPSIAGPSPSSLHIAGNEVTRPPANNPGLTRARQFAHPSTAVALGAHAPAGAQMAARTSASHGWTTGQPRPSSPILGFSGAGRVRRLQRRLPRPVAHDWRRRRLALGRRPRRHVPRIAVVRSVRAALRRRRARRRGSRAALPAALLRRGLPPERWRRRRALRRARRGRWRRRRRWRWTRWRSPLMRDDARQDERDGGGYS